MTEEQKAFIAASLTRVAEEYYERFIKPHVSSALALAPNGETLRLVVPREISILTAKLIEKDFGIPPMFDGLQLGCGAQSIILLSKGKK